MGKVSTVDAVDAVDAVDVVDAVDAVDEEDNALLRSSLLASLWGECVTLFCRCAISLVLSDTSWFH